MTTTATTSSNKSDYETRQSTHRNIYKAPISKDNLRLEFRPETLQDQRLKEFLEHQRESRIDLFNAARKTLQELFLIDSEDEEPMEVEKHTSSYRRPRSNRFRYRVMLSEWMRQKPEDFVTNWLIVPCPTGYRTIIVAKKGSTKAYTKHGIRVNVFPSALPGGNHDSCHREYAILDCIWISSQEKYYVLDILAWRRQPLTSCEAEFRLFWIGARLSEIETLQVGGNETNRYPICPLPVFSGNVNLSLALQNLDHLHPLDGLLFYHRNAHYFYGKTPAVTWLKPFMLPELFEVQLPVPHDTIPEGYIDCNHYIYEYNRQNRQRRRDKNERNVNSMEVVEGERE